MMLAQNIGWFQGADEGSKGEGCRAFLGAQFLDANGFDRSPASGADFAVADGWLNSPRLDFVNNAPDDNAPDAVNGCTTLFIYLLHSQLGLRDQRHRRRRRGDPCRCLPQPAAATRPTRSRILKKALDDAFPPNATSHVLGPNPDDPFPLPTATFVSWRTSALRRAGGSIAHPRFLADTTGDGRADTFGFGDAGVYRSITRPNGSFEPARVRRRQFRLLMQEAGASNKHPRLLADTTGDGRADIVGFGDAGVYRSVAQPDGSFGPVELVVAEFRLLTQAVGGSKAIRGCWPTPPVMAGPTSSASVMRGCTGRSRSPTARSARCSSSSRTSAPSRAGGSIEHPRFLADTTGDGRADIVGFGDAGRLPVGGAARRIVRTGGTRRGRISALTQAVGGSKAIRGCWPTPPVMAGPTSSASVMPGSTGRSRSPTARSDRWSSSSRTSAPQQGWRVDRIHASSPTPPVTAGPTSSASVMRAVLLTLAQADWQLRAVPVADPELRLCAARRRVAGREPPAAARRHHRRPAGRHRRLRRRGRLRGTCTSRRQLRRDDRPYPNLTGAGENGGVRRCGCEAARAGVTEVRGAGLAPRCRRLRPSAWRR